MSSNKSFKTERVKEENDVQICLYLHGLLEHPPDDHSSKDILYDEAIPFLQCQKLKLRTPLR